MGIFRGCSGKHASDYLLPLLSWILVALPFLFPILFPLSWIAFVPLLLLVEWSKTLRRAFFMGWLAGGVANLLGFYWLDYTLRGFGGFPHGAGEVVFFCFCFEPRPFSQSGKYPL